MAADTERNKNEQSSFTNKIKVWSISGEDTTPV